MYSNQKRKCSPTSKATILPDIQSNRPPISNSSYGPTTQWLEIGTNLSGFFAYTSFLHIVSCLSKSPREQHPHLIIRLPPFPLLPGLLHLRNQHLDLFKLPAHDALEHVQREALDALVQEQQRVQPDALEARVLGPPANRHLPRPRDHVDVARVLNVPAHLVVDLKGAAHALAGLGKERVPSVVDVVGRRNVRQGADVELDVLDVPAGLGAAEGFAVERGPVRDAAVQVAQVDKVKVVGRVGPGELGVIDLKAEVGRDPGGLDRADVEADDRSRGELVGKVAG